MFCGSRVRLDVGGAGNAQGMLQFHALSPRRQLNDKFGILAPLGLGAQARDRLDGCDAGFGLKRKDAFQFQPRRRADVAMFSSPSMQAPQRRAISQESLVSYERLEFGHVGHAQNAENAQKPIRSDYFFRRPSTRLMTVAENNFLPSSLSSSCNFPSWASFSRIIAVVIPSVPRGKFFLI